MNYKQVVIPILLADHACRPGWSAGPWVKSTTCSTLSSGRREQDAHADAAAVGISQGGVPGASEMTDEVSQCFGLAYLLDGQHIRSQLGDGSGQGGEFGLVGRRL